MEEKETKDPNDVDTKSLGYRMGECLGVTCIFAVMIIVAALTAKIVLWMF